MAALGPQLEQYVHGGLHLWASLLLFGFENLKDKLAAPRMALDSFEEYASGVSYNDPQLGFEVFLVIRLG